MENADRRKFLGLCLGGLTAASAVAIAYPVYRYLAPQSGGETSANVVIPEKELPEGEAKFFEFAGTAAVLVKTKKDGVVALSAVCTHLGCIVQWDKEKQIFICPCHGGRFTTEGNVISGPPPKPLVKLSATVAGGNITVGKAIL